MSRPLPQAPFVVTRLGGQGLTRAEARHPSLGRPTRGVRTPREWPLDMVARCRALGLVVPAGGVFSGPSAAVLLGMPLPYRLENGPVHIAVPSDAVRARRVGVVPHQLDLTDEEVSIARGLPVTSPARTYADLAGMVRIADLVAIGDCVLRTGSTTAEQLRSVVTRRLRYRGKVQARMALDLLDPRAESPQESRTRVLLWQAGFPAPEVNFVVTDAFGDFIARVDLAYPDGRVAIEYDGEVHFTRERRDADATRRALLQEHGWYVVELTAVDLREPQRALAKIRAALRTRGVLQ